MFTQLPGRAHAPKTHPTGVVLTLVAALATGGCSKSPQTNEGAVETPILDVIEFPALEESPYDHFELIIHEGVASPDDETAPAADRIPQVRMIGHLDDGTSEEAVFRSEHAAATMAVYEAVGEPTVEDLDSGWESPEDVDLTEFDTALQDLDDSGDLVNEMSRAYEAYLEAEPASRPIFAGELACSYDLYRRLAIEALALPFAAKVIAFLKFPCEKAPGALAKAKCTGAKTGGLVAMAIVGTGLADLRIRMPQHQGHLDQVISLTNTDDVGVAARNARTGNAAAVLSNAKSMYSQQMFMSEDYVVMAAALAHATAAAIVMAGCTPGTLWADDFLLAACVTSDLALVAARAFIGRYWDCANAVVHPRFATNAVRLQLGNYDHAGVMKWIKATGIKDIFTPVKEELLPPKVWNDEALWIDNGAKGTIVIDAADEPGIVSPFDEAAQTQYATVYACEGVVVPPDPATYLFGSFFRQNGPSDYTLNSDGGSWWIDGLLTTVTRLNKNFATATAHRVCDDDNDHDGHPDMDPAATCGCLPDAAGHCEIHSVALMSQMPIHGETDWASNSSLLNPTPNGYNCQTVSIPLVSKNGDTGKRVKETARLDVTPPWTAESDGHVVGPGGAAGNGHSTGLYLSVIHEDWGKPIAKNGECYEWGPLQAPDTEGWRCVENAAGCMCPDDGGGGPGGGGPGGGDPGGGDPGGGGV